ncbi:MAG: DUF4393 domain-containing protein [Microcoleus sp.]
MSGDENGTPIIPSEARSGLAKDAFGPAARRFGAKVEPLGEEIGEVIVKAVRLTISAGSNIVWGFDRVADWLQEAVQKRLNGVPAEDLTESNPRILYPTAQALVYTGPDQEIRELFANLIASDMRISTKGDVHPAFVEIIKEMTVGDAKVLEVIHTNGPQRICYYRRATANPTDQAPIWTEVATHISINVAGLNFEQLSISVSNLERLGMLSMKDYFPISELFDEYEMHNENTDWMQQIFAEIASSQLEVIKTKQGLYLTPFGWGFCKVCL